MGLASLGLHRFGEVLLLRLGLGTRLRKRVCRFGLGWYPFIGAWIPTDIMFKLIGGGGIGMDVGLSIKFL